VSNGESVVRQNILTMASKMHVYVLLKFFRREYMLAIRPNVIFIESFYNFDTMVLTNSPQDHMIKENIFSTPMRHT